VCEIPVYLAYPLHERLGGNATQGVTKQAFLAWWLGKGITSASQVGKAVGTQTPACT
jgi:hypothetical protein